MVSALSPNKNRGEAPPYADEFAGGSDVSTDARSAIPLSRKIREDLVIASSSDDQGITHTTVIEPGRMLALADFSPPSLSAGERLIRLAYS
ncbi:MAG: hypothetical protein ABIQ66_08310, partial [Novosphingobium sp.]